MALFDKPFFNSMHDTPYFDNVHIFHMTLFDTPYFNNVNYPHMTLFDTPFFITLACAGFQEQHKYAMMIFQLLMYLMPPPPPPVRTPLLGNSNWFSTTKSYIYS